MSNLNKIPKEITIGGQNIKIEIVDSINSYSTSLGEESATASEEYRLPPIEDKGA